MWRVWVSLGRINPGNVLIPPAMDLHGLPWIRGKGIHEHRIIRSCRVQMCHVHCRNAWMTCLGVVFSADNEGCHVINTGLISPQISSFQCNQLLDGHVRILVVINIFISGQIQLFKHLNKYLLGCQPGRLAFVLLLRDTIHPTTLRMWGLCQLRRWFCCRYAFSKWWCEGIFWRPLAHCFPGWLQKRLVIRFWNVIVMIISIGGYHAEIILEILIVDTLSASPCAGRKRRRNRCVAPWCHDIKWWQVINTKELKEWLKQMRINVKWMNWSVR